MLAAHKYSVRTHPNNKRAQLSQLEPRIELSSITIEATNPARACHVLPRSLSYVPAGHSLMQGPTNP
jgi:hypothetical protein